MSDLINLLNDKHLKLDIVWGNHDVAGVSALTLPTSPLSVLKSAGVINLLNNEPYTPPQTLHQTGNITIYGAGFGEEIPIPKDVIAYNILVIHAMIGNRQLFPSQELENPKRFLKQNPGYSLIICGHYHYRFIETFEGRAILNAGALVRESISEFDTNHKPGIVIFDTDTNKAEVIELTFEPVEKVFDLTPTVKRDNTLLNKFIERLKTGSKSATSGWKQVLANVIKEKRTSEGGKLVIDKALEEISTK
jgi:predicted phosphodiesterase